jgi:hypothetical protein
MKEHLTDASIAAAASKSTYTGAGLNITSWSNLRLGGL